MSNLIAINSLPTIQEFQTMKELGTMAVKSGLIPTSINTPEKAVIIMLKGRELGIPPMQAFSSIAVVNGKPTMSAELMLAMIYKNVPGAIVNFDITDSKKCEISAKRPNGKSTKFSFTMDDAKTANLTGKGPWMTYPAAMLRARCVSAMARAMFPDALSGVVYTPEELGAEVDDDGNILDVAPKDAEPKKPDLEKLEAVNYDSHAYQERVKEQQAKIPEVFNDDNLGEFVCNFGKQFKGLKIKDIAVDDLEKFLVWAKEQTSLHPSVVVFAENAEAYLYSKNL